MAGLQKDIHPSPGQRKERKKREEKIAGVIFVTTNITTASNDNNTNNNTHSKDNNCHRHCIDNIFSSNYHAEHKHTKASLGVL